MNYRAADASHEAVVQFCVASRGLEELRRANAPVRREAHRALRDQREAMLAHMTAHRLTALPCSAHVSPPQCARVMQRRTGRLNLRDPEQIVRGVAMAAADAGAVAGAGPKDAVCALLERAYKESGSAKQSLTISRRARVDAEPPPLAGSAAHRGRQMAERLCQAAAEVRALRAREREQCQPQLARQQALQQRVREHMERHDPSSQSQRILLSDNGETKTYYLTKLIATAKPRVTLRAATALLVAAVEGVPLGGAPFSEWIRADANQRLLCARLRDAMDRHAEQHAQRTVKVALRARALPRRAAAAE